MTKSLGLRILVVGSADSTGVHSITGSSDNSVAMKGAMCLLTTSLTLLLPRLLLYLIWLPTKRKSLMYVAVSA